jgi:hypothetical protein
LLIWDFNVSFGIVNTYFLFHFLAATIVNKSNRLFQFLGQFFAQSHQENLDKDTKLEKTKLKEEESIQKPIPSPSVPSPNANSTDLIYQRSKYF